MARRARDYKAEEARRNALAKERGFTSRGQQRRRIETGKAPAIQPYRLRKPQTIEAQKFRLGSATKGVESKGSNLPVFGSRRGDRERAEDWSDIYARSVAAQYLPDERPQGMSKAAYTDAYMAAFVTGSERYVEVRRSGGSDALRHWFVDVIEYMTADEYESRYGAKE